MEKKKLYNNENLQDQWHTIKWLNSLIVEINEELEMPLKSYKHKYKYKLRILQVLKMHSN